MSQKGTYTGIISANAYDPGSAFWRNRGMSTDHNGADYGTRGVTGVPVVASMAGKVVNVNCQSIGFGMSVVVSTILPDGRTVIATYGHVLATAGLKIGDTVDARQVIGTVEDANTLKRRGGTLPSDFTGPHLHYRLSVDGVPTDPYNFDIPIVNTATTSFYGKVFDWISPDEACGSEGVTIEDALAFDNDYRVVHYNGYISNSDYSIVTDWSSNNLVTPSYTFNTGYTYNYNDFIPIEPIGAFYESTSLANDPALSIADKTPVVLNTAGQGMTASQLTALDANRDGKLSGTELGALTLWADRNENGRIDAGEVTAAAQLGVSEIKADDYGYYTRGNSRFGQSASVPGRPSESTGVPAAPGMVNIGASAAQTAPNSTPPVEAIEGVPASNFRSLRDTDNIYYYSGGYILWAANQVKINYNNRSYLIGSDGNDNFDASYYAKYDPIYFNTSLLVNFLGGGGDDTVGGSARNDRIWGGAGNDTLLGYAGADKLYGEEGDDHLQGGTGDDNLFGGLGNDRLLSSFAVDLKR